jgi:hypothetical protein
MQKSSVYCVWQECENDLNFLKETQFSFLKKVSISYETLRYDKTADYKVLVYCGEPDAVINISKEVIGRQDEFDLILTWKEDVLTNCKNSQKFLFGGPKTIKDSNLNIDKQNQISYLTSSKNLTKGHLLRQSIWNFLTSHDFDGNYHFLIHKSPAYIDKELIFNNAKFSIIVENSVEKNYFSEKLIDCLSTKTIPIYNGCPNIEDYFDQTSFLIFNSLDELVQIIENLKEDHYECCLESIQKNYELSKQYWDYYGRIKNTIEQKIMGNEL